MENILKENERIDDLQLNDLKIIQRTDGFCFGIDSVLLSDFSKNIKKNCSVVDLGTGTGIISVLLCAKTHLRKIYGIEIQEEIADMATRTSQLNKLEDKFEVINCDIKNLDKVLGRESVDYVVTNPPYKKSNSGLTNDNKIKLISRHEVKAELSDFIKVSFKILKDKGTVFMVHRPERLTDIIYEMRKNKIEPKRMRFVHSDTESDPKLVLIEGVKNGKPFLKIEKPLYIYNKDRSYTDEILKIYNKVWNYICVK